MSRSTTILTPPVQTALTTVAAVKAELPGDLSGSALQRLSAVIEQASGMITGYLGREVARASVKDTFYGHHFRRASLVLSRLPVATVTSVTSAGALQDLSTLDLDHSTGVLHVHGHQVEVIYDGGYVMPGQTGRDLPAALERACIDVVLAVWYRSTRGDPMIRSESIDGIGSTQYLDPAPGAGGMMPPAALAALSPYVNYVV